MIRSGRRNGFTREGGNQRRMTGTAFLDTLQKVEPGPTSSRVQWAMQLERGQETQDDRHHTEADEGRQGAQAERQHELHTERGSLPVDLAVAPSS